MLVAWTHGIGIALDMTSARYHAAGIYAVVLLWCCGDRASPPGFAALDTLKFALPTTQMVIKKLTL